MKRALSLLKEVYLRLGKRWFSSILTVLGVTGLLLYIVRYGAELTRLTHLALPQIVLLMVLVIVGRATVAFKFKLSTKLFDIDLSTSEAIMLVESGTLINFLPFSAMSFRALYLKRIHNLRYVDFGMSTFALGIAAFISAGFWGLLGLAHIYSRGTNSPSGLLLLIFVLYLLGPVVAFFFAWLFRPRFESLETSVELLPDWFGVLLQRVLIGADIILAQPATFFWFVILSLIANLSVSVRFWLIGVWLGYSLEFAYGLVLWNLNQLTTMFTLLPSGAIGFREAITGLGAVGLGQRAISGVLVSSVDRVVTIILNIFLGIISLVILRKRIVKAENQLTFPGTSGKRVKKTVMNERV